MTRSKAWSELDVYDIAVYFQLKAKFHVKSNETNNSRNLSLPYREMEPLMCKERFTKSLDKLIAVGLIDIVDHRPHSRKCSIYGLSSRWHNYGTAEFVEKKRAVLSRPQKVAIDGKK